MTKAEEYKLLTIKRMAKQLTKEQEHFFYRIYPEGPTPKQFDTAIDQIERTLKKNEEKGT